VNVPTVALFGPTDPALTGPYGPRHAVFRGACPFAPCFRRRCRLGTSACQRTLKPAAVAAAVLERLAGHAEPP
ncbi:MAG: glycosyltransferase family 9 protein, partial [bacterium]